MNINSVLISDDIDPICPKILTDHGIKVTQKTKLSSEQLKKELASHDALIVRSATTVTKDVLAAVPDLKLVGRAGTGVDNIDLQEATNRGVIVMNTPAGNSCSAAELTCTMILSLTRKVPQAHQSMKEGKWERKRFMGSEVSGKTLALIGLGRIGQYVATRMQAFGMRTIGFDPLISAESAREFGVEWMELEEIWPLADYITLHVPLTSQTKGLISAKVFTKTKRGVAIVNCARGGIVDESDLLEAIESGSCSGAALDVFAEEPPSNKGLIGHPNIISIPHLGASTKEAQFRVAEEISEQIVHLKEGKGTKGALNAAALSASLDPSKLTWLKTVEKLSVVLAAVAKSRKHKLSTVDVEFPQACKGMELALKAAVAIGLLKESSSNGLNFINADTFAKANGISVAVKAGNTKLATVSCENSDHLRISGLASEAGPILISIGSATFPTGIFCQGTFVLSHQGDLIKAFADNQESCMGIVRSKETGLNKCCIALFDSSENLGDTLKSACVTVHF